jgi:hypothetical protein
VWYVREGKKSGILSLEDLMYFGNGEVPAMEIEKLDNCAETRLAQPPNGMESEWKNQYNCLSPMKTSEVTPEERLAIAEQELAIAQQRLEYEKQRFEAQTERMEGVIRRVQYLDYGS